MAKSKHHSENEHLRGRIRELESEVKQLKRVASRHIKKVRQYENIMDNAPDDAESEKIEREFQAHTKPKCPECNAALDIFEIAVRDKVKELHMCVSCGHRKTYSKQVI